MDTTTAPHPTLSALRGALRVMEDAKDAGLPVPENVTISSYAAIRFGGETEVSWQPKTLDGLYEWATYLNEPVEHVPHNATIQHRLEAVVFDQRVSLCYIEQVA